MYYVANPVGIWLFERFDDAWDFAMDEIHDYQEFPTDDFSNTTIGLLRTS